MEILTVNRSWILLLCSSLVLAGDVLSVALNCSSGNGWYGVDRTSEKGLPCSAPKCTLPVMEVNESSSRDYPTITFKWTANKRLNLPEQFYIIMIVVDGNNEEFMSYTVQSTGSGKRLPFIMNCAVLSHNGIDITALLKTECGCSPPLQFCYPGKCYQPNFQPNASSRPVTSLPQTQTYPYTSDPKSYVLPIVLVIVLVMCVVSAGVWKRRKRARGESDQEALTPPPISVISQNHLPSGPREWQLQDHCANVPSKNGDCVNNIPGADVSTSESSSVTSISQLVTLVDVIPRPKCSESPPSSREGCEDLLQELYRFSVSESEADDDLLQV